MKKTKSTYLTLVALLVSPMAANAELILFEWSDGTNSMSWVLDSNPVPDFVTSDAFGIDNVSVSVNEAAGELASIFFVNDVFGGGLTVCSAGGGNPCSLGLLGPEIYSGTLDQPMFAPGTFDFVSFYYPGGGAPMSSTLTLTSAVPGTLLQNLGDEVTGIGPGKSLANKIMLAQTYLAVPDVQSTCAVLSGFLNQVQAQRGKKLTPEQADMFTADVETITAAIGCD